MNLSRFSPDIPRKLDLKKPTIINVARLSYEKNQECLIRAVKDLDVKLLLVGDGPYYSQLKDLVEESSDNQDIIDSIQITINQFNARIAGLNPELDIEELEELAREIESATTNLERSNLRSNELQQSISNLEASINAELIKIDNFESQLNDNKSIAWIQPVRNNVESFANAAGMDGILAGFAALIFCLVCKRRKDWFKQIFRIFFK